MREGIGDGHGDDRREIGSRIGACCAGKLEDDHRFAINRADQRAVASGQRPRNALAIVEASADYGRNCGGICESHGCDRIRSCREGDLIPDSALRCFSGQAGRGAGGVALGNVIASHFAVKCGLVDSEVR